MESSNTFLVMVFFIGLAIGSLIVGVVSSSNINKRQIDIVSCMEITGRNYDGYEYCISHYDPLLFQMIEEADYRELPETSNNQ